MLVQSQKPKVQDVYNNLKSENFDNVKSFLVNREGFSLDQVEYMQEEYIKFISICFEHSSKLNPIVISDKVDPFWHAHILFTEEYRGMCERIFDEKGSYLNHLPTKTGDEIVFLEKNYKEGTIPLYEKYFGKASKEFWLENAMICGGSGCSYLGTGND